MTGPPDGAAAPQPPPPRRIIDLRSDTVTRPTPKMMAAMVAAEVGDDVWGDDPTINALQDISAVCRSRGLRLHLDGARLFNAFVEAGYGAADVGPLFDSISICLSKGLGCPVGSLLLGTKDFIRRAHRIRKVLGGGMRQAGFLAAAGLYALHNNVDRLREDHARARRLGAALSGLPYVAAVAPVDTNIAIFTVAPGWDAKALVEALRVQHGVLISTMGHGVLRLVTHLDVGDEEVDEVCGLLRGLADSQQVVGVAEGAAKEAAAVVGTVDMGAAAALAVAANGGAVNGGGY
ncbi:L-allo-threonine aldolase [Tetrabaena socialis]|uniref:L-allo-threonine aldolase n=1 Tax=Tetrabaena socialis TaxID=47790 RepID=A0A2J8AEW3_9CHLO|nr:L-allo-threonine aldolase [Tetrabaena socialis]|eukprot:PNH11057.1 L-allo-threonine aldolase [Tetrabaena socialis]